MFEKSDSSKKAPNVFITIIDRDNNDGSNKKVYTKSGIQESILDDSILLLSDGFNLMLSDGSSLSINKQ